MCIVKLYSKSKEDEIQKKKITTCHHFIHLHMFRDFIGIPIFFIPDVSGSLSGVVLKITSVGTYVAFVSFPMCSSCLSEAFVLESIQLYAIVYVHLQLSDPSKKLLTFSIELPSTLIMMLDL
ncbi:hypothetical protein CHS0354_042209 [Potamilus streckersoni]|uniref:Uncharacterized protein n=1 Tax=Potamilus streckersoni TaxID=2493646 RepID=A0AAE0TQY6_9BIVA|nr:hypothetical protein CHS0354_042209 [Potamilus streckersoni]